MNKELNFTDKNSTTDLNYRKTRIIIRDKVTGEIIFTGHNKVLIHGADTIARKIFDFAAASSTSFIPSYDTILSLDTNVPSGTSEIAATSSEVYNKVGYTTSATKTDNRVLVFCVGKDGCGSESSQVYAVDYKNWISAKELIPFRFPSSTSDLSETERAIYFGRKTISTIDGDKIAYYFKKFEAQPSISLKLGANNLSSSDFDSVTGLVNSAEDAETYVDVSLSITTDDIREYFIYSTTEEYARINSIELCTAYPVKDSSASGWHLAFRNIKPIARLNFPNEILSDPSKGIDINYRIYF